MAGRAARDGAGRVPAARPRTRLCHRLRSHPVGKGKRRSMGNRDFIALIDGTHQLVKAPIRLVLDRLNTHVSHAMREIWGQSKRSQASLAVVGLDRLPSCPDASQLTRSRNPFEADRARERMENRRLGVGEFGGPPMAPCKVPPESSRGVEGPALRSPGNSPVESACDTRDTGRDQCQLRPVANVARER
ncbi:hypothetical protein GCM10010377_55920 [Streptomyces viridiviolaceus]|nr:hypothetical protein GCM10010377_55920 [Streptomyces viridiviolaceus]